MQLHAKRRLLGMGVRSDVLELVAVRWPSAEEPALRSCLGGHGCLDTGLDAHPLALRHAAEERHHEIVGFAARVDGATDLGHPEGDAVVGEHGEGEPELVAVEGALRLADHDGIEAPGRVAERLQQSVRLGPPLPWQRSAVADVEVLLDDRAVAVDELPAAFELPRP